MSPEVPSRSADGTGPRLGRQDRPRRRRRPARADAHRPRDPRAHQGRRGPRPARHPHPRRPPGPPARRADRRRRGPRGPGRRARHHDVPRRPAAAARPARSSATEIPAGGIDGKLVVLVDDVLFSGRTVRAALDALATSAARAPCSWRCSSTAATASCRSAPTTSARTSPPRSAETVRVQPRRARRRRRRAHRARRAGGRPVKQHLLSAADLSRDDADPRPRHRRGAAPGWPTGRSRSCRPCAAAPWSTCSSRTPPAPGSPSRRPPSG